MRHLHHLHRAGGLVGTEDDRLAADLVADQPAAAVADRLGGVGAGNVAELDAHDRLLEAQPVVAVPDPELQLVRHEIVAVRLHVVRAFVSRLERHHRGVAVPGPPLGQRRELPRQVLEGSARVGPADRREAELRPQGVVGAVEQQHVRVDEQARDSERVRPAVEPAVHHAHRVTQRAVDGGDGHAAHHVVDGLVVHQGPDRIGPRLAAEGHADHAVVVAQMIRLVDGHALGVAQRGDAVLGRPPEGDLVLGDDQVLDVELGRQRLRLPPHELLQLGVGGVHLLPRPKLGKPPGDRQTDERARHGEDQGAEHQPRRRPLVLPSPRRLVHGFLLVRRSARPTGRRGGLFRLRQGKVAWKTISRS